MKTIEERAREYAPEPLNDHYAIPAFIASEDRRQAYIKGATEQKAIDIETVCNIFCHTACPHKTDSYDCLKDKCDALKAFKRMMAE